MKRKPCHAGNVSKSLILLCLVVMTFGGWVIVKAQKLPLPGKSCPVGHRQSLGLTPI
jgi:hypothetical protein